MRDDASTADLEVPAAAAGERLDRFLASRLGSRAAAEQAVLDGALVDGRARPKSFRLAGGERIVLAEPPERPLTVTSVPAPRIAWQDEHLAVVDKPAGLVVHPGAGHRGDTLVDALAGTVAGGDPERPGIVHRLDRDTSGLLVVARSPEAYRAAVGARPPAGARAHVPRARPRHAQVAERPDRGRDRPRPR